MQLYEEILLHAVKQGKFSLTADQTIFSLTADQTITNACYQALFEIKAVLENDHLTDEDCFWRIEEIVRIFEEIGSDAGSRHDFG